MLMETGDIIDMDELSFPLNADNLFGLIDTIVQKSVAEGDPETAFNLGRDFITIEKRSGKALGHLAFTLKDRWMEFNVSEPFEDVALNHWDVSKVHLERLIRTAEMLQSGDIPEQLQATFEEKSVKDLIVVSAAWQSGYLDESTEEEWQALAEADNDYEIRDAVRELKGVEPRKHTLNIWMARTGDLYCTVGSGEQKYIGHLDVDTMDDPDVEKAINRIINNSRIGKQ